MSADEAFQLLKDVHKLSADKTIIVVMADYGSDPSLLSYGACLSSIRSFEIELSNLKIFAFRGWNAMAALRRGWRGSCSHYSHRFLHH